MPLFGGGTALPYIPAGGGDPSGGMNIFGGMFGQAGGPGGITGLFQDRNFLSMLAGMGGRFGAGQSAGEAIGAPAMRTLAALSSQEALKGAEAKREQFNKEILKILSGLTPKEEEGFTSLKAGPGGLTLDLTPPGAPPGAAGTAAAAAGGAAGLPTSPNLAPVTGGGPASFDAVPFTDPGGLPPIAPGEDIVGTPRTKGAATGRGGGDEFKFSDIFPF